MNEDFTFNFTNVFELDLLTMWTVVIGTICETTHILRNINK